LFNHANYYVQNGDGINQLQYNPIGTPQGQYPCGDGISTNQTCFLVPNSGPGNFGTKMSRRKEKGQPGAPQGRPDKPSRLEGQLLPR
jgi:hypothetical protein